MLDQLRIAMLKRLEKINARAQALDLPQAFVSEFDEHLSKGNALIEKDDFSAAETHFRAALALQPTSEKALVNLGFALKSQARLAESRVYFARAIALNPDSSLAYETHYLLGVVSEEQGDLEGAITCLEKAFALKPDFALACKDLCRLLFRKRDLQRAQAVLDMGLAKTPQYADLHFYQGNLCLEKGDMASARQSYMNALNLRPDAAFYSALGMIHYRVGDKAQAMQCFENAERLEPGCIVAAQLASGECYLHSGEHAQAVANFEVAIALNPSMLKAHSLLLCCLSLYPGGSSAYKDAAQRYAAIVTAQTADCMRPAKKTYAAGSRALKVGFVSGDFHAHPVGFFIEGILAALDRSRIEAIAYAHTRHEDAITARLKPQFSQWNDIKHLSDDAVAQLIRQHDIDILVDLAGHTADNRLPIFARQPAPVQVAWLGYFASTGLTQMDYILADPISSPVNSSEFFSEQVWCLPDTRLCMTPPVVQPPIDVPPPPSVTNGYITFGSFQARTKLNQSVLSLWSQVLSSVPRSVLRLQIPGIGEAIARNELMGQLTAAGIDMNRVTLHSGVHWEAYLAAYQFVDIILDTFTYPGGTTTAEALWMGVPTISLQGETMLGRQGAGMLTCVGLGDWVATSEREYLAKAIQHASDIPALAQLRAELRERTLRSALFDAPRFAKNLQAAFEGMFQAAK